jgi:hypothetical protein
MFHESWMSPVGAPVAKFQSVRNPEIGTRVNKHGVHMSEIEDRVVICKLQPVRLEWTCFS